ncbi:hypothetical protein SEA_JEMERALD_49 [Microbacterium phage Jemerald]|nr:membrane protein [Microbacterium phage Juicer]WNO27288.1 hypothetical protein SEA_JEMERALD_49 [Microbacterium phage Jemerald]
MWYENLFAACWVLIQGIFWLGCVIVALALLLMLVLGLWQAIQPKAKDDRQKRLDNAEAAAVSRYRLKSEESHVRAFVEGSAYMWDALHRKK